MSMILGMLPSVLMIVAPILITAIGGMICEKSGVVNIALEGLMAIGACTAAAAHVLMEMAGVPQTLSLFLALTMGFVVGGLFSLIHAVAAINLNADQTISGTGINLLSTGVTIFASQILFNADRTKEFMMGMQTDALGIYPTAYIAVAVVVLSWILLYKLPFGMHLRACGEHPGAAESVGINVKKMRYFAVISSGVLAGLAGGCVVLTQTIQYTSNTINGRGFIALAAVSFGRWSPLGVTGAAFLFGTAQAFAIIANNVPALKALPSEVFNILPYVVTLVALVLSSGKNYAPRAAGKPYEKGAS
ncbi:ABC transporter permease [Sphaerochaeta sp. S2]|uniref:ABC transporter permease n=1 Tax=Sphaerochaeta sp. S2 TaxID=2798868 RepID=UPI0018E9BFFC|nr:ABC transporter permease [Sphaerochaeta sp. S2]MBJ2357717.1 ABC transporter permease [Sphaerochaeta sp. S2]MCK9349068.1 ABC transporter permease [Sphaerochaeta sp.]MDC7229128.1 ABC transporter permease [Sphaerochaetaceae bacterium]MDD4302261.1 ABC transporter permease [Sphaerochaeta sp.]